MKSGFKSTVSIIIQIYILVRFGHTIHYYSDIYQSRNMEINLCNRCHEETITIEKCDLCNTVFKSLCPECNLLFEVSHLNCNEIPKLNKVILE